MSQRHFSEFQPIAVVGMACIFPGSSDLKAFWNLLFNGKDAISQVPSKTHWDPDVYFDSDPSCNDHVYCNRGGFLPPINFNPMEFGIPPKNIEITDTAQLLGLHVAKMALKDAGLLPGDPALQEKKVNVVLGVTGTQELVIPLGTRLGFPVWEKALDQAGVSGKQKQRILDQIQGSFVQWQENSFPGLLGNVVAGRIANKFNLSGTNCVSDAACASSLAAVHTSVMELSTGRCDMSITGGVDTLNDIFMHMCFAKTGVLSHTGDARPFSQDADGTVLGEGIGMVVLKRLEDAHQDNDRIYAVIKGVGTSSDGKTSGIYAPDANGQLKALNDAYARAGINPSSVGLVEAHGTGTRVGDKVEFTALRQCFGNKGSGVPAVLGSVKSMIGHTKAAAGAAGMIKSILALHNKVLPPTLKINKPDPNLEIDSSRFYLNQNSKPWVSSKPRRSGVSAFGFGGSNFHIVLEEAESKKSHVSWDGSVQIFAFSASADSDLIEKLENFSVKLDSEHMNKLDDAQKNQYIANLSYQSRMEFNYKDFHRILGVCKKTDDLQVLINQCIEKIKKPSEKLSLSNLIFYGNGIPDGKIGFLFPGQGSQYVNMGKELFSFFPEAIQSLESAQKTFDLDKNLDQFLFPLPEYARNSEDNSDTLQQTQIAQPAIGALSFAMTRVLERFGLRPNMACGHSFGELSALAGAGWISQQDFFSLARGRGKLMAEAGDKAGDPGSMLAIQSSIDKIEALIKEEQLDLVIANRNTPLQGVISGSTELINKAADLCKQRKMRAVKLPVAAAFHSSLVDQAAKPFTKLVEKINFTPTKISILSNTTGNFYPEDKDKVIQLLGAQLAHPVDFISNVNQMYKNGIRCFLEVGPKNVLTGLTKAILKGKKDINVMAMDSSCGKDSNIFDLAKILANLSAKGYKLNLSSWEDPVEKVKPAKMSIPLSGANIKPEPISSDKMTSEATPENDTCARDKSSELGTKGNNNMNNKDQNNFDSRHGTPESAGTNTNSSSVSFSSLHLLENGFEAIRELQAQTARAHEKFLETQALASKTLGNMLEHSRMAVTGINMPIDYSKADYSKESVSKSPVLEPVVSNSKNEGSSNSDSIVELDSLEVAEEKKETQFSLVSKPPVQVNTGSLETLKEIVSSLTGFPVEMLDASMNMESDLGIDSIKKVEILSELEKRFPHAGDISSDNMVKVATLEDMCNLLAQDPIVLQNQHPAKTDNNDFPSSQGLNGTTEKLSYESGLYPLLIEVVSELTGFPVEMLEPSMELDSDLGVDSIKRVEILSLLERKMPDLPNVLPDEMAKVKTLEDIALVFKSGTQNEGQDKKKTPGNVAPL